MIVLDENLKDQILLNAIANWYPGTVTHIKSFRPLTVIKDDAIPTLLLTASQPTFVTVNVDDFWRKTEAHQGFCLVAFVLAQDKVDDLPELLRRLLNMPNFKSKALRMGKVIRVQANNVRYYERDRQIHVLDW